MIGTLLNVAGILLGGILGLTLHKTLSAPRQAFLKVALGVFAIFYGLRLTWISLYGAPLLILKQLLIAVLAMMLGALAGRLLRLQHSSNRLGRLARERLATLSPSHPAGPMEGFRLCTVLFCAAPLAILGAVPDGLSSYPYPLAVKAVMDGLAAMGFVSLFGWSVLLAALPVLAMQGTLSLLCAQWFKPFLDSHGSMLLDSVNACDGLLIFCVGMMILEIKKIRLADYLPSLALAPLLTWLWH